MYADTPVVNRSSTARQPIIVFLGSVFIGFSLFAPLKEASMSAILRALEGKIDVCPLGASTCRRPKSPCPALPVLFQLRLARPAAKRRPAPPRPSYVRVFDAPNV